MRNIELKKYAYPLKSKTKCDDHLTAFIHNYTRGLANAVKQKQKQKIDTHSKKRKKKKKADNRNVYMDMMIL